MSFKLKSRNLFFIALIVSQFSFAQLKFTKNENKDLSPLIELYQKQIYTLKKTVVVYNWSVNAGLGDDPSQIQTAKSSANTFWNAFGNSNNGGNMYGYGLYAAIDPFISSGFGGSGDSWRILEMKLPQGFRVLDLTIPVNITDSNLKARINEILGFFECPYNADPDKLMMNGGAALTEKCQLLVRKLFQEVLKIDGFFYSYSSAYMKGCDRSSSSSYKAIVITQDHWMNSENVSFYTPTSTHKIEERIRIQTLLLLSATDSKQFEVFTSENKKLMIDFLDIHPQHSLHKSTTRCDGDSCTITINFCNRQNSCENLDLLPIPRPDGPLITSSEALKKHKNSSFLAKLLWKDIEGQPKSATIKEWIVNNIYGCDGAKPYQEGN